MCVCVCVCDLTQSELSSRQQSRASFSKVGNRNLKIGNSMNDTESCDLLSLIPYGGVRGQATVTFDLHVLHQMSL